MSHCFSVCHPQKHRLRDKPRAAVAMLLLLLLVSLMLVPTVHATDGDAAVQALAAKLTPLNALSGRFSQVQTDSAGEVLSRSSGDFTMQRPGLLRWEATEPFPQLLVTDGVQIWLYDEDLEQVTISPVTTQLNQTPAIIFSGDLLKIEQNFHVIDHGNATFTLRPKTHNEAFQQLDLEFEGQLIKRLTILDGFGQTTEFELSGVKREGPLPVSRFQFQPLPGIDVLRQP